MKKPSCSVILEVRWTLFKNVHRGTPIASTGPFLIKTGWNKYVCLNEDSTGSIFVIQIKAGGVGLNLQNATRVYITSPAWNPATEIQAIGRSHRTGQTKTVRVCRLITEDVDERVASIEKTLIRLQEAKALEFSKLMSNVGEMGKLPQMGNPDLKALTALFAPPKPEQSEEIVG